MIQNPYQNLNVEFHILQSFPVTCLNRDDVGAPKTAVVGGTTRSRVSSQCWKRQVRLAMREFGANLGIRTKFIAQLITDACLKNGATSDQAIHLAELVSSELSGEVEGDESKGSTLLFITQTEADAFAKKMKDFQFSFIKLDADIEALSKEIKELKNKKKKKENIDEVALAEAELKLKDLKEDRDIATIFKKNFDPAIDGLDIALFGRMVAKAATMNVEAAASFAHAISTHKVTNEVEFFTALDDNPTQQGSAHMGSLEFNSATYYRYVSLNVGQLSQTLAGQNIPDAVECFVKALFVAVPSARQTTQSGASPWEFAKILVRKGQRLQVPFETAVPYKNAGFLEPSKKEMCEYLDRKEKLAGSLFGKIKSFEFGENLDFNIDQLIASIKTAIAEGSKK